MDEQITTLASLTIDGKGSYGIGASAVPFSKDLYTYLRITDIKDDGTLNLQDLKSVDDEKASEYLLKPNDIVFARTGASTGRNYFYDGTDGEFVYAGFLIKFSIDKKKVNPKYIKYFCQSKQYKDWINSFNTGSTRGNINAQTLGKMPIPLIERKTQDALVCILSSIDEKINKNNEINNNLPQDSMVSHLFLNLLDEIKTLGLERNNAYQTVKDGNKTYRLTLDSSYDINEFQKNLKKELEKESDRSLLYECDVLITDRLSEESLFFNGGDISVLTEKELKEISGITSSTIEKMKNDCNRPKVIRLIDRNKALGELK